MAFNNKITTRLYKSVSVPLILTPAIALFFVSEGCKPKDIPRPTVLEQEVSTNNQNVASSRANTGYSTNHSQTGGYVARPGVYPSGAYRAPNEVNSFTKSYQTPSSSYSTVSKSTPTPAKSTSVARGGFGSTGHAIGGIGA